MNAPLSKRSKIKDILIRIKTNRMKPPHKSIAFKEIKTAAIFTGLYQYQQQQKRIDQFVDDFKLSNIKSMLIILYPTKDPNTISSAPSNEHLHLYLKDLSNFGFPKSERANSWNASVDLFINLNAAFSYADMGMALASKASYRVSPYLKEYKPYYNILIKAPQDENLNDYLCSVKDFFEHL
jgi:hypothetical protein